MKSELQILALLRVINTDAHQASLLDEILRLRRSHE